MSYIGSPGFFCCNCSLKSQGMKNYLDLININKKSLIVITNNYDIKKEKFLKIQLK